MPSSPFLLPTTEETDELIIERDPREPTVWLVRHRGLRLVVGSAPWPKAAILLSRAEFQNPSCYAIIGGAPSQLGMPAVPETHVGRTGRPPVRTRQHRQSPPLSPVRTLVIITTDDEKGLLFDEAAALERALHVEAARAGSHKVVSRPPRDRGLPPGVITRVNRWLDSLRWMLAVAGCTILEAKQDNPDPGLTPDLDTVAPAAEAEVLPPAVGWTTAFPRDLLKRPDARWFQLDHPEVSATALVVDGWCVVTKGSRARVKEIRSIQPGLKNKRLTLVSSGLLKPVCGRKDVLETTRDIGLPSLINAGRLLLGSNTRGRRWRRIS
ncbi:hypothetical protein IC232_11435 [Microvirga sp. BT688]|uniref:hypothetical protein n=1 Tax=Microvirga sp. TaxID=1873136 RepID=UPI001687DD33|nr:hypothetical protein [Microvirga sp.]MBD2747304.1 hypothetical protein [Microvirga sp.]